MDSWSFPHDEYKKRNKFVISIFDEYISSTRKVIIPIKVEELFCDSFIKNECAVIHNKIPLYYDDDHV